MRCLWVLWYLLWLFKSLPVTLCNLMALKAVGHRAAGSLDTSVHYLFFCVVPGFSLEEAHLEEQKHSYNIPNNCFSVLIWVFTVYLWFQRPTHLHLFNICRVVSTDSGNFTFHRTKMTRAKISSPIRMLIMMTQRGIPPKASFETLIFTWVEHTAIL